MEIFFYKVIIYICIRIVLQITGFEEGISSGINIEVDDIIEPSNSNNVSKEELIKKITLLGEEEYIKKVLEEECTNPSDKIIQNIASYIDIEKSSSSIEKSYEKTDVNKADVNKAEEVHDTWKNDMYKSLDMDKDFEISEDIENKLKDEQYAYEEKYDVKDLDKVSNRSEEIENKKEVVKQAALSSRREVTRDETAKEWLHRCAEFNETPVEIPINKSSSASASASSEAGNQDKYYGDAEQYIPKEESAIDQVLIEECSTDEDDDDELAMQTALVLDMIEEYENAKKTEEQDTDTETQIEECEDEDESALQKALDMIEESSTDEDEDDEDGNK